MRTPKKKYFCNEIEASSRANDLGKRWALINNLVGKSLKTSNISELLIDDVSTLYDRSIAETFNDFFVTIGTKLASGVSGNVSDKTHFILYKLFT